MAKAYDINRKATGVWMGVRRCGCPVAVATDYGEDAPRQMNSHVNKCKRDFLRDGLSVVYATWEEWQTVYFPKFKRDCEHERTAPAPKALELPLSDDAVARSAAS